VKIQKNIVLSPDKLFIFVKLEARGSKLEAYQKKNTP